MPSLNTRVRKILRFLRNWSPSPEVHDLAQTMGPKPHDCSEAVPRYTKPSPSRIASKEFQPDSLTKRVDPNFNLTHPTSTSCAGNLQGCTIDDTSPPTSTPSIDLLTSLPPTAPATHTSPNIPMATLPTINLLGNSRHASVGEVHIVSAGGSVTNPSSIFITNHSGSVHIHQYAIGPSDNEIYPEVPEPPRRPHRGPWRRSTWAAGDR